MSNREMNNRDEARELELQTGECPDCHCIPCRCDDDFDDGYDPDGRDCYWCGGDGWDECDDPIQATSTRSSRMRKAITSRNFAVAARAAEAGWRRT